MRNKFIYNCPKFSGCKWSYQKFPVNIISVEWIENDCNENDIELYPYGCIVVTAHDGRGFDYQSKLKCYISRNGRYAVWGNHRLYEGYSGSIILRGLPHYDSYNIIRNAAKQYGTVVE